MNHGDLHRYRSARVAQVKATPLVVCARGLGGLWDDATLPPRSVAATVVSSSRARGGGPRLKDPSTAASSVALVGAYDGALYCFDCATGATRARRARVDGAVFASPVLLSRSVPRAVFTRLSSGVCRGGGRSHQRMLRRRRDMR